MRFLHSYQYITTEKIGSLIISADQKTICDGHNNIIIGLTNIPSNKHYYLLEIAEANNAMRHNIKIIVNINYNKLYTTIKYDKYIPNKMELIALIKRNSDVPSLLETIETNHIKYQRELRLYKDNIAILNDITINLDTTVFSTKPPETISIDPNRLILIGSYNYNELGKNSLVIYDKFLPNNIPDKILVVHKHKLPKINSNKKWDTVVFIDIDAALADVAARRRLFIYSKLTEEMLPKVLAVFLGTTAVSYDNIYNIAILKKFIVRLKPHRKIKRKSMKLSLFEKRYMGELDKNKLNKYRSFPNNFIHHNFITKADFAKLNRGNGPRVCSICLDTIAINNISFTECGHYFCKKCIYMNLNISNSCPNCRMKIKVGSIHTIGKYVYNNSKLLYILDKINHKKHLLILSDYIETLNNLQSIIKKKYGDIEYYKFSKLESVGTKSFQRNIAIPHEVVFMDTANVNFSYYFDLLTTLLGNFDNYRMLVYE